MKKPVIKSLLPSTIWAILLSIALGSGIYHLNFIVNIFDFKSTYQADLERSIKHKIEHAESLLAQLSKQVTTCNDGAISLLKNQEFLDLNLRLIGWITPDNTLCSSRTNLNGVLRNPPIELEQYSLSQGTQLKLIEDIKDRQLLVVTLSQQTKQWFALLEPIGLEPSQGCLDCAFVLLGKEYRGFVA